VLLHAPGLSKIAESAVGLLFMPGALSIPIFFAAAARLSMSSYPAEYVAMTMTDEGKRSINSGSTLSTEVAKLGQPLLLRQLKAPQCDLCVVNNSRARYSRSMRASTSSGKLRELLTIKVARQVTGVNEKGPFR
jgi:hypothetical protein